MVNFSPVRIWAISSAGVKKTSAGVVSITEVYAVSGGQTDILDICRGSARQGPKNSRRGSGLHMLSVFGFDPP